MNRTSDSAHAELIEAWGGAFAPGGNWLDQRAMNRPTHPALIADGETISYAALARRVEAAAVVLRRCGVRPGDRVGLLLPNGTDFTVAMHAVMRVGAVLVPLDRRLSDAELRARMADAGPALLIHGPAEAERARWAVRLPALALRASGEGVGCAASRCVASAPQAIVYTSGSSGRAKGVVLTYANHFWSAVGCARVLGVDSGDRWLACLPFCHVGGLAILLRSVIYGTTAVIHDGFHPRQVHRAIDEDRVTIISVVAAMLQRLLDARGRQPYPPWLRCVLLGGSPAPRALLEDCAARGLPVAQTYGMTEAASQIATLRPSDAGRKLGSAGTPLPGTELRLVGAHGGRVPTGEVGEIQVRGPTVTPGYWSGGEPGKDGPPFLDDGWFATGDLGCLDKDGFLYVVGRRDDLIISGGENVYPAEVEAVLHTHPAVAEACVVGVPDLRWGTAVAAWVRLRAGASATEAELREHVRAALAAFKVPRRVTVVDDFPRTASGKILRAALVERAAPSGDP